MAKKKKKSAPLIVLALVFLFNPNIQVVDLLPDFVAYFIFARLLEKPALAAPYFEEAKSSALKLGFLTLLKAPAFVLAIMIRSKNTLDNDVFPMLALIFASLEILFSLIFIKNLSNAFFHLGERATASALIKPFTISRVERREMRPEELKNFTVFFVIAKCALYTLPEFLLLTRTASNGLIMPSPLSKFYPITILLALALGFFIGGIWLGRSQKYLQAVLDEGEFTNSLNFLKSKTTEKEYETKVTLRTVNRAFFLVALASLFTYPMIFEDAELINIFPGFIFASLFVYALFSLRKYVSQKNTTLLISGTVYALISIVAFVLSVNFLTKYDYVDLIKVNFESQNAAKNTYIPVIISSAIELIALAVLFFFAFKYLNAFIKENTGLSPNSERYSRNEADYHKALTVRLILFFAFGFFAAFLKFIEIYLYLSPKMFFNVAKDDVTNKVLHTSEVVSPAIPWFGVLVTIFSILFIGYAIYFTHIIREEVEMKHKKA